MSFLPQNSGQMEEGQSDAQHPTQMQPQGAEQTSDLNQPQTTATAEPLLENWVQKEAPVHVQEKADPAAQPQTKPLWRPIPPLLPERCHYTTIETRDQGCQTDEPSHGHSTGG